jgi:5,10-methenyltetrahydromethanopterin hydrogenase
MPLVTAAATRLVQQVSQQRTVLVKNVGANPVEVSKDPAIVFGTADNFNLAAGAEERIELEAGDSLFGRCAATFQSQVDVI